MSLLGLGLFLLFFNERHLSIDLIHINKQIKKLFGVLNDFQYYK